MPRGTCLSTARDIESRRGGEPPGHQETQRVRLSGRFGRAPNRVSGRDSDPGQWLCARGGRRQVNRIAQHHLRRPPQAHRSCALSWPASVRRAAVRPARFLPPLDLQPHRCRPTRLRSPGPDHPLFADRLQLADPVRHAPLLAGEIHTQLANAPNRRWSHPPQQPPQDPRRFYVARTQRAESCERKVRLRKRQYGRL